MCHVPRLAVLRSPHGKKDSRTEEFALRMVKFYICFHVQHITSLAMLKVTLAATLLV